MRGGCLDGLGGKRFQALTMPPILPQCPTHRQRIGPLQDTAKARRRPLGLLEPLADVVDGVRCIPQVGIELLDGLVHDREGLIASD